MVGISQSIHLFRSPGLTLVDVGSGVGTDPDDDDEAPQGTVVSTQ
jgi:hypothetical protein